MVLSLVNTFPLYSHMHSCLEERGEPYLDRSSTVSLEDGHLLRLVQQITRTRPSIEFSSGASVSTAVNLANATSTSGVTNPNSASAVANPEALVGTGSETSASRFKVEEVPNYEPILFTTSESGTRLFPVTMRNFFVL